MVRMSNTFIAFFNLITLLISIAAIGGSIWFSTHPASICQKVIQKPLLYIGLALFVVSLFGLIGSCCRVQFVLWIYLVVMFLFIIALMCFSVFAILVTNKGIGKAVSGRGYKEYRLGDYSNWLQMYVVNGTNWDKVKSCLVDAHVCSRLGGNPHETAADFDKRNLSPTESGCCKPPSYCGLEFKNATFWTVPKTGPAVPDSDCTAWSNDQSVLCYNCKSCKAGILAIFSYSRRLLAMINAGVLVFVIILYSIGCCALRNNRSSRYQRYKGYP
ncbi:tetraspanin-8-like [Camellia sinensis]|uniref:Tetraspanin-8 n=1 Tax=Camellia sinensis var. sinensis TaxID=542762 RepID=A0A4S4E0M3_CAMSN|nr:tetraspanin-8-like [Camellia sinensis]THG08656.1 hypothetical protein TEA_015526 [Camellia sinensis var. sinensis]